MALEDQVEAYVGTIADTGALDQFLTDAARTLVDVIPPDRAEPFLSHVSVPTGTLDATGYRVLAIEVDGRPAIRHPQTHKTALSEVGSIHKATAFTPAYYFEAGSVFYLPSSGTGFLSGIPYPMVSGADDAIVNFPPGLVPAVIVDAASRVLRRKSVDTIINELATHAFSAQVAPSSPTLPTISYSDAAAAGVSSPTWDNFGSAPTYTPPTLGTLATKPTAFAPTATPPTPPAAPDFAYTDAVAGTVGTITVAALPSAPAYAYGVNNALPAGSTLPSVDFSGVTAITPPTAPSIAYSDAAVSAVAAVTLGSLGSVPTYTYGGNNALPTGTVVTIDLTTSLTLPTVPAAPTGSDFAYATASVGSLTAPPTALDISSDLTTLGTQLDTNQDIELSMAILERIKMKIEKYIQESRMIVEGNLQVQRTTTDVNLKNAGEAANTMIQLYTAKLAQYSRALEGIVQGIQRKKMEYELQQSEFQIKSGVNIKDAENRYQLSLEIYRSTVQGAMEQLRQDAEKARVTAQLTTDLNLKNELETLAAAFQNYQMVLGKYDGDLKNYGAQIQTKVHEFQLKQADFQLKSEVTMRDALQRFQASTVEYQAEVGKRIKDAEIASQRVLTQAQLTTDVDLKNKLQTWQNQVQEYSASLERFQQQVLIYKTQVEAEYQTYDANMKVWAKDCENKLQIYQLDMVNAKGSYEAALAVYQASVQKAIHKADLDLQATIAASKMTTDVSIQNKAQGLGALIASGKQSLEKYAEDLQAFQIKVQQELGRYNAVLQKIVATVQAYSEQAKELRSIYQMTIQLFLGVEAKA